MKTDARCELRGCSRGRKYFKMDKQNFSPKTLSYVIFQQVFCKLQVCLTVHRPRKMTWDARLMQQGNFIGIFLARHVSGT